MATPSRALDQNTPNEDAPAWFAPLQVLDIDLAQPMRALLPATDTQGNEYRKGMVLVRDGGRPIATVRSSSSLKVSMRRAGCPGTCAWARPG